jgi:Spy/CpxP family protein refolding chaperone
MKALLTTVLALGLAASAAAANTPSPYAGWQVRDIKALSPEEIDDLRAGRGMSLALAAELNGYPGPRHVLDLGAELAVSDDQRRALERLFTEMQSAAQDLGAGILRQEAALDAAFQRGDLDEAELQRHLAALETLRGELRFVHLRAHLATKALLSGDQVARYNELRGYAGRPATGHGGGGHRHQPGPH